MYRCVFIKGINAINHTGFIDQGRALKLIFGATFLAFLVNGVPWAVLEVKKPPIFKKKDVCPV
jgi:hypothetical protein